jgi:hypothetical protein
MQRQIAIFDNYSSTAMPPDNIVLPLAVIHRSDEVFVIQIIKLSDSTNWTVLNTCYFTSYESHFPMSHLLNSNIELSLIVFTSVCMLTIDKLMLYEDPLFYAHSSA